MGQIIGPLGQRLRATDLRIGGNHNGARGLWNSHARRGRPHRWGFADGTGKKICGESNSGRGTHGADGGKFRRKKPPWCPCSNRSRLHTTITPPPHLAYQTQQKQPPTHNPPDTINIPVPHPHQQQQTYQSTLNKRERCGRGPHIGTGGNPGWNQGGQTYYHCGGKHTGSYWGQGTGGPTPPWQQQKTKGIPGHIWELPVLRYHKILVIYPYPIFWW